MADVIPLVDLAASYAEIRDEVEPIILDRLRSGDYLGADTISAFEREWAAYVGGGVEAVACSSGTDAVELMVRATTQYGDTIACDRRTFVAQIAAVERAGRTPVEGPFDGEWCRPGTTVLATWLYGSTANADVYASQCREQGATLLEDASQAHGNKRAGTIGDAAAWSLYPSKNLGACGQAGVVTFKDPIAAARARRIREHGYDRKHDRHFERGFNMRMDAVQADILRAKLKRLDGWVARRREIAALYNESIPPMVRRPMIEPDHAWHIYAINVDARDDVQRRMREQGVVTGVHYRRDAFGRETEWSRTTLSLPMYPQMTDEQVERVVRALEKSL
jgi:dTDP-4-amino-4,6-dideoxygalactose transaminase